MKLTPFGERVRHLRIRYDVSMKAMADAQGISSSHLSGVEYGEKTLSDRIAGGALQFFASTATPDELAELRKSIDQSKGVISVSKLKPEARNLVAAFARRLQEGAAPTADLTRWLDSKIK